MATAEQYAAWLTDHEALHNTPEYDTVVEAYQAAKAAGGGGTGTAAPAPETPSVPGRVAGNFARDAIMAPIQLGGIVGNLPTAAYNLGKYGLNKAFGTDFQRTPLPTEAAENLLTDAGLPSPATPAERVASGINRSLLGTGGILAMAPKLAGLAPELSKFLSTQPTMQIASAATAPAAGGVAREMGAGPAGELAATLAGGFLPFAGSAGLRGLARGGAAGQNELQQRLETLSGAGVTQPSVGLATGARRVEQAESALAGVSSSSGVMDPVAGKLHSDIGVRVGKLANDLAPGADPTMAGLTIEGGIKNFVARFRDKQGQLYDRVDRFIPADAPTPVTNTMQTLDSLSTPIAGAEATSPLVQSPGVAAMRDAVSQDAAQGTMPWSAVQKLRSSIGEKIASPDLLSDISTARWKQLYGALSNDMQSMADSVSPNAASALRVANQYTASNHALIDGVLSRVANGNTAEKVFQMAANPAEMKIGGSTITSVMKSLLPAERDVVTASVIRRLGIAREGAAGEFSSANFLGNYRAMTPEAKAALFPNAQLRNDLDQVASAAQMIKEGSNVFKNPGGTTPALSNQITHWAVPGAIISGRFKLAGGLAVLLAGAHVSARMLTNPDFVHWLALSTKMPAAAMPAMFNRLDTISQKWPPEDKAAIQEGLSGLSQQVPR